VQGAYDGIQKLKTSLPTEWWCHTDLIFVNLNSRKTFFFFNFYICTMHLDTTKAYYSPTNAQGIVTAPKHVETIAM
jgi:hypothetical protein